jgi:hypothetical protein
MVQLVQRQANQENFKPEEFFSTSHKCRVLYVWCKDHYTIHLTFTLYSVDGPNYFWKPTVIKSYNQSSCDTYMLTN